MTSSSLTYLWAAEQIIRKHGRPLSAAEIVTFAQSSDLFSNAMYSKTPQKSLQARVSIEIIRNKEKSKFVRTAKGRFFLREFLIPDKSFDEVPAFHSERPLFAVYEAPRREPSPSKERVLVIPQKHFKDVLGFQGLRADNGRLVSRLIKGRLEYLPRTVAEGTEAYKQVVTYVLVTCGDLVLTFERGRFSRVAEFLRGSLCIGFGGHVIEEDRNLFSYRDGGASENALRELTEELAGVGNLKKGREESGLEIIGIINDDSSDVGRKHVAVVYRYRIQDWATWQKVSRGEASVNKLRWLDTQRERVNLTEYEYWSQLCWREFFPDVVQAQPVYRIFRKQPFRKQHLLVVLGCIGSGKSVATDYLSEHLGYARVNSGHVLAKLLDVRPVPGTSRAKFQALAWKFIAKSHGPEKLARALLAAAAKTGADRVVIDGVRHRATLEAIRRLARVPVAVLFVHATPDIAYEFYKAREHKGRATISPQVFLQLMNGDTEHEIPHLMPDADAVLYNWTGVSKFREALRGMARDLGL